MSKLRQVQDKYKNRREVCAVCGQGVTPFAEGTHVVHDFESDKTKFYHWECRADKARKVERLMVESGFED